MTTDEQRKMLELAAKAAGKVIDKSEKNGGGKNNTGFDILGNAVLDWHNAKVWNPITSSADCGELEAKISELGDIEIKFLKNCALIIFRPTSCEFSLSVEYCTYHNGDRQAARCLAVTRLAARIGEMME